MSTQNLRFKLKVPVALMLIGSAYVTSAWAVQMPALKDAPLPNYDIRVGYTSVNLKDPRIKEESKVLRAQKSQLRTNALPAKTAPAISIDQKKLEAAFGKDVNVIFNAETPSLVFNEKGSLSAPVNVSADTAALGFLQNHQEVFGLSREDVSNLRVLRTLASSASGSKQVNLQQTINGLPVFGADFKVGLDKNHAVLSVGGKFYPGLQVSGNAALSAIDAVKQAAQHVGEWSSQNSAKSVGKVWDNTIHLQDWSPASLAAAKENSASQPQVLKTENTPEHQTIVSAGPFQHDILVQQIVFPLNKTQGRLAWQVSLHKSMTEWYQVLVDAENGNLLNRTNLVQFANEQANVFLKNPGSTPLSTQSMIGIAPATSGSYSFAGSSGQAGNNVFMMIGANEKSGTTHDYTYPFANSYLTSGTLQTINLGTNRKLAFFPNASGSYNMGIGTLTTLPAGTNLGLTDDSSVCSAIGFAFSFFGQAVSQVCVNSNGNLTFETGDPVNWYGDPLDLPPRGRIMPLHTDLNPGAGGSVSVDSSVTGRLCFIWSAVPEYGTTNSNSFSTCLFSDNRIWLQYPTGGLTATSAFVGIRPPATNTQVTGIAQPTGGAAWTSMNAGENTRGKTGLVRYFPDMGTDEKVLGSNLFWQFNRFGHDRHWRNNGFTDAAGNFQLTNTGGGIGGDPVILSGIPAKFGTNNAFFGTPPEGQCCGYSGFYLFTGPSNNGPFRNVHSGFDSDVTLHEYAHGLTNRLVGGPGNPLALWAQQSGSLGEGWSDFYAFSYSGDYVMGEYSTGNTTTGIRNVAYTATNGRDLGQYGSIYGPFGANAANVYLPEVHNDGEIWASFLADVIRSLTAPSPGPGLTALAVEKLVSEALFFTPSNPSMIEAANALLIADGSLYGGTHTCTLWNVMKGRGFGKHAANNDIDPAYLMSGNSYSVFAGRDRPTGCGGSYSNGTLKHAASFEAAVGATTAGGWTGNGLWHVSARRYSAGAKSFYYGQEATGNYDTGAATYGSLVSPLLNLSGTTNPVLEFDVAMGTEDSFPYDTLWVQLSTDSGATFPIQRSILTYTTYDFYYNDIKFQHVKIDLKPLKGISTAKLMFYFDSLNSGFNTYEGVYIDNVQVRDYVEN